MTAEIIPFDRHDPAHPVVHRIVDEEDQAQPSDALILAFNGLVDALQRIEACGDSMSAAIAREALSR